MTTRKPLTPAQSGRLGGLAAADAMTAEQRRERARKGAAAVQKKYGRAHMTRIRLGLPAKEVGASKTALSATD